MSEKTVTPIWTPDDYQQAVLDASRHRAYPGKMVPEGTPITWKMFPEELAIPGLIVGHSAHSGEPLFEVEWTDTDGATGRSYITVDQIVSVSEPRGRKVSLLADEHTVYATEMLAGDGTVTFHTDAEAAGLAPGSRSLLTPAELKARDEAVMAALRRLDDHTDEFATLGTHRPRQTRRFRRLVVAALVGVLGLGVAAVVAADKANAQPAGMECVDQLWIVPFQSNRRTICDGPVRADGSWLRAREFYTPAHQVPMHTYCSGGRSYSSCTTSGGYFQERTSQGIETYDVRPDNVLPDEPAHIGGGAAGTGVVA